jgi:hypothetical protein
MLRSAPLRVKPKVFTNELVGKLVALQRCQYYANSSTVDEHVRDALQHYTHEPSVPLALQAQTSILRLASRHNVFGPGVKSALQASLSRLEDLSADDACLCVVNALQLAQDHAGVAFDEEAALHSVARRAGSVPVSSISALIRAAVRRRPDLFRLAETIIMVKAGEFNARECCFQLENIAEAVMRWGNVEAAKHASGVVDVLAARITQDSKRVGTARLEAVHQQLALVGLPSESLQAVIELRRSRLCGDDPSQAARRDAEDLEKADGAYIADIVEWLQRCASQSRQTATDGADDSTRVSRRRTLRKLDREVALLASEVSLAQDHVTRGLHLLLGLSMSGLLNVLILMRESRIDDRRIVTAVLTRVMDLRPHWTLHRICRLLPLLNALHVPDGMRQPLGDGSRGDSGEITLLRVTREASRVAAEHLRAEGWGTIPLPSIARAARSDVALHGDDAPFAHQLAEVVGPRFESAHIQSADDRSLLSLLRWLAHLPLSRASAFASTLLQSSRSKEVVEQLRTTHIPWEELQHLFVAVVRAPALTEARTEIISFCVQTFRSLAGNGQKWTHALPVHFAASLLQRTGSGNDAQDATRLRVPALLNFAVDLAVARRHEWTAEETLSVLERLTQLGCNASDDLEKLALRVMQSEGAATDVAAKDVARILYAFAATGRVPAKIRDIALPRVRLGAAFYSAAEIVRVLYAHRLLRLPLHRSTGGELLVRIPQTVDGADVRVLALLATEIRGAMDLNRGQLDPSQVAAACVAVLGRLKTLDPKADLAAYGTVAATAPLLVTRSGATHVPLKVLADPLIHLGETLDGAATVATSEYDGDNRTQPSLRLTPAVTAQCIVAVDRLLNLHRQFTTISEAPSDKSLPHVRADHPSDSAAEPQAAPPLDALRRQRLQVGVLAFGRSLGTGAQHLPVLMAVDVACALARAGYDFDGDVTLTHARVKLENPLLLHLRAVASHWIELRRTTAELEECGLLRVLRLRGTASSTAEEPVEAEVDVDATAVRVSVRKPRIPAFNGKGSTPAAKSERVKSAKKLSAVKRVSKSAGARSKAVTLATKLGSRRSSKGLRASR